ncbi:MAG: helical backbone metal receptor [Ignavibacteria bacterium]|nr:helical backbone metal receptor [Ignavibacteria bacterium]
MKKVNNIFLYLLLVSLITFYCKENTDKINKSLTFIDDLGNEIKIDTPPKRIISLAPNITETIYAIEADTFLVGVTDYCNYPQTCKSKQTVGGMINPNIEKISSLKPDIIFLTVEGNSKSTYNSLIENNFNVFVTNPRDINGIKKLINDIGIITNRRNQSNYLCAKIDSTIKYYDSINSVKSKAKVLFLLSINPIITINKSTYINNVLELAGYENIYAEVELPYPQINYEDILVRDPEYIIITSEIATNWSDYREILQKNLSTTKAIKENKIIVIDADIISRPGPRIINALQELVNNKGR